MKSIKTQIQQNSNVKLYDYNMAVSRRKSYFQSILLWMFEKRILYTNTDVKADETKGANSQLLNSSSIEVTSMKV